MPAGGTFVGAGSAEPTLVREINSCGPNVGDHLEVLETWLQQSTFMKDVACAITAVCPQDLANKVEIYRSLRQQLPHLVPCLPKGGFCEYRVVNFMTTDVIHCDPNDWGLTVIFLVGNFPPHHLCLPEIGTKILVRPGSLTLLASAYLDHFVESWRKFLLPGEPPAQRYGLILTSRKNTHHWFVRRPRNPITAQAELTRGDNGLIRPTAPDSSADPVTRAADYDFSGPSLPAAEEDDYTDTFNALQNEPSGSRTSRPSTNAEEVRERSSLPQVRKRRVVPYVDIQVRKKQ